jgi:hypothetical protein
MRLRKVGLLFLEVMEEELRPVDVDDNNLLIMHHQTLPPNHDWIHNAT